MVAVADESAQQPSSSGSEETADAVTGGGPGITEWKQIFDAPAADLVGTDVQLEDIPVRARSGRGVWVGYKGQQIFVVPIDPSVVDFLAVGARVVIHGTLRRTPSAPQGAKVFALDRRSSRRLAAHRLYIDAWALTSVP